MMPVVVDDRTPYDRLCVVDVASGAVTQFADSPHVWDMAWVDDGALVAVVSDEPTAALRGIIPDWPVSTSRLANSRRATCPLRLASSAPTPSPDGHTVAFVTCSWSDPAIPGAISVRLPSPPAMPRRSI